MPINRSERYAQLTTNRKEFNMRKKKFCVVLAIFTIALAATTDATGNDRYQAGGPPGQIALTHGNVIDVRSGEI
ncbi:uncharacterized protein METZ01_LOCUS458188, partial [marine metagenome]